jgi:hypothetical protein
MKESVACGGRRQIPRMQQQKNQMFRSNTSRSRTPHLLYCLLVVLAVEHHDDEASCVEIWRQDRAERKTRPRPSKILVRLVWTGENIHGRVGRGMRRHDTPAYALHGIATAPSGVFPTGPRPRQASSLQLARIHGSDPSTWMDFLNFRGARARATPYLPAHARCSAERPSVTLGTGHCGAADHRVRRARAYVRPPCNRYTLQI